MPTVLSGMRSYFRKATESQVNSVGETDSSLEHEISISQMKEYLSK
jgi:hypothetical protein